MPANAKYLSSKGQRWLKISAGILGGYLASMAIHIAIGAVLEHKSALVLTTAYSTFFLWIAFMVFAFLSKNGWKVWGWMLLIIAICSTIIVLFKQ
ncbi:hypothetical protein [Maribacter sp. 2307UL18-2]|uniref:hypothetical protein n=1 Tax=Maribacter sp. 2307UL18-2 TaxID=3386274 RepID=UPI0039BC35B1